MAAGDDGVEQRAATTFAADAHARAPPRSVGVVAVGGGTMFVVVAAAAVVVTAVAVVGRRRRAEQGGAVRRADAHLGPRLSRPDGLRGRRVRGERRRDARGPALPEGHGERSRSELHFQLAGTENVVLLAVNSLAVNGALQLYCMQCPKVSSTHYVASESVLYPLCSVSKCLSHARYKTHCFSGLQARFTHRSPENEGSTMQVYQNGVGCGAWSCGAGSAATRSASRFASRSASSASLVSSCSCLNCASVFLMSCVSTSVL